MQAYPLLSKTVTARGAVAPCRFVRADGAQATDTDIPLGISPQDVQDRYAAILAGTALLEVGGPVSYGELLGPDAQGRGVRSSTGYAIAMQSASNAGQYIEVLLLQAAVARPTIYNAANANIEPIGVALISNPTTNIIQMNLRAPRPTEQVTIRAATPINAAVRVRLAPGVTFAGVTHNMATFDAVGDELIVAYDTDTTWRVLGNISVSLTTV